MTKSKIGMDVDSSGGNTCDAQSSMEKHLIAIPVPGGASGEGLPYAPEAWPCAGDIWRWKVGQRKAASGHWLDRSIYLPSRLHKISGGKGVFQSRLSLEEYIRKEFPNTDIDAFFASFIWRVPCANHTPRKDVDNITCSYASPKILNVNGRSGSELSTGARDCKAGNKTCNLRVKARSYALEAKACDICCSEPSFCRDCCCILCCKSVDWAYGGYSFMRCEAIVDANYICGHVAHLDCALRAYMAGTVGGSIGLDVEYYCRRCDNKTDLFPHVSKLIKTCESLNARDDMIKILSLGLCILRGSEQVRAKNLRSHIGLAMAKLKHGVDVGKMWEEEAKISTLAAGDMPNVGMLGAVNIERTNRASMNGTELSHENDTADGGSQRPVYISSDHCNVSVKLEDEIDHVLQELKKSQESEYRLAEQKLYAQKDFLISLYRQLEAERSELASPSQLLPNGGDTDALLTNALNRVDQIKNEEVKLQQMMKIAKGFGRTSKSILTDYLGLPTDD